MFKSLVIICLVCAVIIEARPKWQFLPPMPGYIPVYIRTGDTPLEEINPELAEAFHALPAGRSAGKLLEASPDLLPEQTDIDSIVDTTVYEKKDLEKKKKASEADVVKPVEHR